MKEHVSSIYRPISAHLLGVRYSLHVCVCGAAYQSIVTVMAI